MIRNFPNSSDKNINRKKSRPDCYRLLFQSETRTQKRAWKSFCLNALFGSPKRVSTPPAYIKRDHSPRPPGIHISVTLFCHPYACTDSKTNIWVPTIPAVSEISLSACNWTSSAVIKSLDIAGEFRCLFYLRPSRPPQFRYSRDCSIVSHSYWLIPNPICAFSDISNLARDLDGVRSMNILTPVWHPRKIRYSNSFINVTSIAGSPPEGRPLYVHN